MCDSPSRPLVIGPPSLREEVTGPNGWVRDVIPGALMDLRGDEGQPLAEVAVSALIEAAGVMTAICQLRVRRVTPLHRVRPIWSP